MNESIGSGNSRKEDILERSRNSKQDEGVDYAKKQGYSIGRHAFGAVAVALVVFSIITEQMTTIHAIVSTVFAFSFGELLAHYLFTKNMLHLAGAALFALLSFSQAYFFVSAVLGW